MSNFTLIEQKSNPYTKSIKKIQYVVLTESKTNVINVYMLTLSSIKQLLKDLKDKPKNIYIFKYWQTKNTPFEMILNIPLDHYYNKMIINNYKKNNYKKDKDQIIISLGYELIEQIRMNKVTDNQVKLVDNLEHIIII
jgi:hypothetical protein